MMVDFTPRSSDGVDENVSAYQRLGEGFFRELAAAARSVGGELDEAVMSFGRALGARRPDMPNLDLGGGFSVQDVYNAAGGVVDEVAAFARGEPPIAVQEEKAIQAMIETQARALIAGKTAGRYDNLEDWFADIQDRHNALYVEYKTALTRSPARRPAKSLPDDVAALQALGNKATAAENDLARFLAQTTAGGRGLIDFTPREAQTYRALQRARNRAAWTFKSRSQAWAEATGRSSTTLAERGE